MDDVSKFTFEYVPWRGVEKSALRTYGVLTKVDATGKPMSIGFRYPNGDTKIRLIDKKEFYWVKQSSEASSLRPDNKPPGLFGQDKFAAGSAKCVTITEGEVDAVSLYQVVRAPVVSVTSSNSGVRDCSASWEYLNSFETIYLALDSDAPGREAAAGIAKLFDRDRVKVVKFSNRKDANEYLQAGEDNELLNVWTNAKKFVPENVVFSNAEFRKILEEPLKVGIPYPWPLLTAMTGGIRTGETVLLKAKEKVGKTELMHFIEHKILKETTDNVAAIFLEETKQRHLLALAGVELQRAIHLPDSVSKPDEGIRALEQLLQKDERLYVYSHFGSDDPDVLLDTIRFLVSACNCRYVLFDHITMACSGLTGENERRNLEYLATKLEMLVKELDFALIMVSHVNDNGQTRGSHYLTKVADITIDASRDLMALDYDERNTIHLTIPYSRYPGKTGKCCKLVFDQQAYRYREQGYEELLYVPSPSVVPGTQVGWKTPEEAS